MANYPRNWPLGVPFQTLIPSAFLQALEDWLVKTPNFQDGSNHNSAAQVILGGAGASIQPLASTDLRATITNAHILDVLAGAKVVVESAGLIELKPGGQLTADSGATILVSATDGSNGPAVLDVYGTQNLRNGANLDAKSGSVSTWENGSLAHVFGQWVLQTNGSGVSTDGLLTIGALFGGKGRVELNAGSDGPSTIKVFDDCQINLSSSDVAHPALLNIGNRCVEHVQSGGTLLVDSGGTVTANGGSTVNFAGSIGNLAQVVFNAFANVVDSGAWSHLGAHAYGGASSITGQPSFVGATVTLDAASTLLQAGTITQSGIAGFTNYRDSGAQTLTDGNSVNVTDNDVWTFTLPNINNARQTLHGVAGKNHRFEVIYQVGSANIGYLRWNGADGISFKGGGTGQSVHMYFRSIGTTVELLHVDDAGPGGNVLARAQ